MGKAVGSRTQTRPAPTQFLQTLHCLSSKNHVVKLAMSKTMVGPPTTFPPDSVVPGGGNRGPKGKWQLTRTRPAYGGWRIGRGTRLHLPRGWPSLPLHYLESLGVEGSSDPCFQGAGTCQARRQGRGVGGCSPPSPSPNLQAQPPHSLQQKGLVGKQAVALSLQPHGPPPTAPERGLSGGRRDTSTGTAGTDIFKSPIAQGVLSLF